MRFVLRFLSASFLHMMLVLLPLVIVIMYVGIDRDTLKASIREAQVYEKFGPAVVEAQAKNQSTPQDGGNASNPLEDPELQEVIARSFDSELLKNEFEDTIDSSYAWLDGSEDMLSFTLDLQPIQTALITNVSEYIKSRADKLPVCTQPEEVRGADIFDLTCRPPDFSAEQVRAEVEKSFNENDMFDEWTIASGDIRVPGDDRSAADSSDVSIEQKLEHAPDVYMGLRSLALLTSLTTFIAFGLFVYIRRPFQEALKPLSKHMLSAGILIAVPSGFVAFLARHAVSSASQSNADALEQLAFSFARVHGAKVATGFMSFGVLYAVFGTVLIVERFIARRRAASPNDQPSSPGK